MKTDIYYKDPFRNTPWTGRLILAALGTVLAVALAMALNGHTLGNTTLMVAFAFSVVSTMAALVLLGRIGRYTKICRRIYVMVWTAYVSAVFGRLSSKLWSPAFMSSTIFSAVWMIVMGFIQIPNMLRALEIRRAEDQIETEMLRNNSSNFHRTDDRTSVDDPFYNLNE